MLEREVKRNFAEKCIFRRQLVSLIAHIVLTMFLYFILVFSDCKNFSVNLHLLPRPLIGLSTVLMSFLVAAALIKTIWCYCKLFGERNAAFSIKMSYAMAFLAGMSLYVLFAIKLSEMYCK